MLQHGKGLIPLLLFSSIVFPVQADAEMAQADNEVIEEIITIGTRTKARSTPDCGSLPHQILGLPYSQFTPFGFNGRFFYGRLTYNF